VALILPTPQPMRRLYVTPSRFLARLRRSGPWWVWLAVIPLPSLATGAQLTLTWTNNANNENGFYVERRAGSGSYSQIVVVGRNVTSYTDSSLAEGTTYCYRVRAFNGAGVSGYTNEACRATTQTTLNLTVTKSGRGSGTVSSAPAGINCGSDCKEAFPSGALVTLTAAPASGSRFDGWTGGGCNGTAPCMLMGNTNQTVTAAFSSKQLLDK
jgi:Divergent InlB B-repeat domain/Fibronectin type III domain